MNINSLNTVGNFSILKNNKTDNTVTNPNFKAQETVEQTQKQIVNAQTALASYTIPEINTSFKGNINPIEQDSVEQSKVRNVTIKDLDANDVNAAIIEKPGSSFFIPNEKKFILKVDDEQIGYAVVGDDGDKDKLFLISLYTQEHISRKYKGAGTELLKSAVNESIKRGYNGKIRVNATHGSCSTLPFYYKNNFIIEKPDNVKLYGYSQYKNAIIQYAIENDIPVDNMLFDFDRQAYMSLDEKGARAFLEDKRLYKDRTIEQIAQKNINGKNYSSNLIQLPYQNEYVLLVDGEDMEKLKTKFFANLLIKENENGKKHFVIQDLDNYAGNDEQRDFALEALEKLAEENGFDKTTILADLCYKAKSAYKDCPIQFKTENL